MPSPLDDPQASSPSIESRADPIDSSSSVPVPPELSSSSSAPLAIEDKPAAQPVGEEESVKDDGEEVHVLDVGEGNVVKLDKLGPMIINTDGTLSRIQNWLDLTPFEQERTVRLLVKKRNLVRLQKLDQENKSQTQGEEPLSALKEASKETELER